MFLRPWPFTLSRESYDDQAGNLDRSQGPELDEGVSGRKGVENARLEAEWMLCEVLGLDRVGLYLNFDKPLTEAELLLSGGWWRGGRAVNRSSIYSAARNSWGLNSRSPLPS